MDKGYQEKVEDILREFFDGNDHKVLAWMREPNPMLGGCTPNWMLAVGRGDRLLRWMRAAISENQRP